MAASNIVRSLLSGVAKKAPTLARSGPTRRAMVNIGLNVPDGTTITPEEALEALQKVGVRPMRHTVAQSDSEPTLIAELERALTPEEADAVSAMLRQEAIAQIDDKGAGELYGPAADKWRPFNPDYFLAPSGKRISEEVAAFAGGGVVKKLLGAAELKAVEPAKKADGGLVGGEGDDTLEGGGKAKLVNKVGKGLIDFLDFGAVAGKPKTVKIPGRGEFAAAPVKEIDDAAEAYMRKHGIPGTHRIEAYPEFDEEFAAKIAEHYDRAKHSPQDPEVRKTYDALIEEVLAQTRAAEDTGIDIRFLKEGQTDPYALSPSLGYADIVDNGRLTVFPTDFGFGSSAAFDPSENPLLKKVGRVGDKPDAVANDAFRVVHDLYGHYGPGNPFFRHTGEDRAWQHHGRMFSDEALPAMTAETRGQNSWLNFGPHGEHNRKASGADTIFADQKSIAMPSWAYAKDLGREPKFAGGGVVLRADADSMTHDTSYGTGVDDTYLDTLGERVNLGPSTVYHREDGTRYSPAEHGAQLAHDAARLGVYGLGPVGTAVGASLDMTEALNTGDPTEAALAVAFGPGGKYAKAAVSGALAYGMDPAEAEAGMYGKLAKWAMSKEGDEAFEYALDAAQRGEDPEAIRQATGWFRDLDGQWKFERSSAGGSVNLKGGAKIGDVYYDPHIFDQYPQLADMQFRRMNEEGAYFDKGVPEIVLGDYSKPGYNTPEMGGPKGLLDHELYHAKADIEGWPQGMSSKAGRSLVEKDMLRLMGGSKAGTPAFKTGEDLFSTIHGKDGSSLGHARYEAEIGEALARREQLRRELPEGRLSGFSPTHDLMIDMPKAALFYPGKEAQPEQYRALLDYVKQLDAVNAPPPAKKKGKR